MLFDDEDEIKFDSEKDKMDQLIWQTEAQKYENHKSIDQEDELQDDLSDEKNIEQDDKYSESHALKWE